MPSDSCQHVLSLPQKEESIAYLSFDAVMPCARDNHKSLLGATPPRWPSGKASASRAEDPGFEFRFRRDFFRGWVIPVT